MSTVGTVAVSALNFNIFLFYFYANGIMSIYFFVGACFTVHILNRKPSASWPAYWVQTARYNTNMLHLNEIAQN